MKIAIVTFNGFNEIDSFVALTLLNRVQQSGWQAEIVCPTAQVTSMNGVTIQAQRDFSFIPQADAVLFGSGKYTRNLIQDQALLSQLQIDPTRQLIGSQCSGALILSQLGWLDRIPACTDAVTRPFLAEAGVQVLDQPFSASGNIATAGGCLSAQYLAAWVIWRGAGQPALEAAVRSIAPVTEEESYIANILHVITPTAHPHLKPSDSLLPT